MRRGDAGRLGVELARSRVDRRRLGKGRRGGEPWLERGLGAVAVGGEGEQLHAGVQELGENVLVLLGLGVNVEHAVADAHRRVGRLEVGLVLRGEQHRVRLTGAPLDDLHRVGEARRQQRLADLLSDERHGLALVQLLKDGGQVEERERGDGPRLDRHHRVGAVVGVLIEGDRELGIARVDPLEDEGEAAELEPSAFAELPVGDPPAVDRGAVLGAEIAHDDASADVDRGVTPRHGRVADIEIGARSRADRLVPGS